jgi:hypothetical protein
MTLHRNSLLTAAATVLVLYLACLIVGLPGWAPRWSSRWCSSSCWPWSGSSPIRPDLW